MKRKTKNNFNIIPDDVLGWEIFLYLELGDLFNCSLVCRRFCNICDDNNFWKVYGKVYNKFFDEKTLKSKKNIKEIVLNIKENFKLHEKKTSVLNYPKFVFKKREYFGFLIKFNCISLCNARERLKDDKEIVLEAVKHNGYALEYANKKFKDDKDVVLEAVKKNGTVLFFASKNLKDDN